MLVKKLEEELSQSVVKLFDCLRPSKPYILMLCHVLDTLPAPVIKKIFAECKNQIQNGKIKLTHTLGNYLIQACMQKYQKSLMNDPEYNKAILDCF